MRKYCLSYCKGVKINKGKHTAGIQIASLILTLGSRRRWAVKLHAPTTLSPGKPQRSPLNRKLGGPRNRSVRFWRKDLRFLLFCPVTQRMLVVVYGRFGAAIGTHLQGPSSQKRSLKSGKRRFLGLVGIRTPNGPARSVSLYLLRYSGSECKNWHPKSSHVMGLWDNKILGRIFG